MCCLQIKTVQEKVPYLWDVDFSVKTFDCIKKKKNNTAKTLQKIGGTNPDYLLGWSFAERN